MSRSRGGSKSLSVGKGEDEPRPVVSARTLRLFVTDTTGAAASADSTDAPTSSPVDNPAALVTAKNPRWLANREKEVQSEALRDKILSLLDDIDAEEAKDRPALKKSWLRAKRLELRRICFREPDGVIAGEAYFRRARRKLRKAQRRRREQGDGADAGGDSGSERDDGDAASSEEEKAKATRSWTVPGPDGDPRDTGDKQRSKKIKTPRSQGNDEDDGSHHSDNGTFNLNPTGRIARPNPRAKSNETEDAPMKDKKVPKSLERLNRVVRFPVESGFKLGRLIRRHRDKARRGGQRSNSESDGEGDGDHWGNRVGNGAVPTGAAVESDGDNSDARREVVRVIIDGESDECEGGRDNAGSRGKGRRRGRAGSSSSSSSSSSSKGSSSSSSIADIPVLQESVGKKIRDRLTVRRGGGGSGRPKSAGSSGSANDLSGDSARRSAREKEKPKEKKEKNKEKKKEEEKEEKKKKKEKKDEKKAKKKGKDDADSDNEDDGSGGSEARRHEGQGTKKIGGQHNRHSATAKKSPSAENGDPLEFVEL